MTGIDDPRCVWCQRPIPDGEARLRFSIVYHLACWDARVAAERPPEAP